MIALPDLKVDRDPSMHVASLRYFDAEGGFADVVYAAIGQSLPRRLQAVLHASSASDALILAWRSPTETLLLCNDERRLALFHTLSASRTDGCVVDQTGGILVRRLTGGQVPDLMLRLGSIDSLPRLGEARTSRIADLAVTALCVDPGEILLLVERVYAAHLDAWIGSAAADL